MSSGSKGTELFAHAQKIKAVCYGEGRAGKHQVCVHVWICKGECGRTAGEPRLRGVLEGTEQGVSQQVETAGEIWKDGCALFFVRTNLKGNVEKRGRKCMVRYAISRKEKDCRQQKEKEDATERSQTLYSFV